MGLFSTESTQDETIKRLTRERDEARTVRRFERLVALLRRLLT